LRDREREKERETEREFFLHLFFFFCRNVTSANLFGLFQSVGVINGFSSTSALMAAGGTSVAIGYGVYRTYKYFLRCRLKIAIA